MPAEAELNTSNLKLGTESGLLLKTRSGWYCPQGDFYIDPTQKVDRAIITHAHADHSQWGMKHYLSHHFNEGVMKRRLGKDISKTIHKWCSSFVSSCGTYSWKCSNSIRV